MCRVPAPLRALSFLVLMGLLTSACAAPSSPRTRAEGRGPEGTPSEGGLSLSLRTGERRSGMWISASEVAALPTSGPAWEQVKSVADEQAGDANLKDWESNHDVGALAAAFVFART